MDHVKPPGAPLCWGSKYQDGDEECRQCRHQDSCRQEMLYQISRQPVRNYAPQAVPRLTLPPPPPSPTSTVVPLPPKPYFAPPASSVPLPRTGTTQAPVPPPPPQQTYYQQSTGYSLPNPTVNPMGSWHRPGAPSPPYYFTQYPGENTGTRLAKNALLRALEAIFAELMQFFRHWTWPPGQK